ncbi:MAG: hypothetical protein AAFU77_08760 [Myxococcota bacterium]
MFFESVGRGIDELFAGTSAEEVARSAERAHEDRAKLGEEQAELSAAQAQFDQTLANSGYANFEQFVHREGFERAARLNMNEQRKNFDAAFERFEDAKEAPDHLDRHAEALYETHIDAPRAQFEAAVETFRANGRSELAQALVTGRRTIERDRAAMVEFDERFRAYEQEYQHFCALNDGVGEDLEDLLEAVGDEIEDVRDAQEDLGESIAEWQDDAREWAAWTAQRKSGDTEQVDQSVEAHLDAVERLKQALAAELPAT